MTDKIRLKRIKAGHYKYKFYDIIKWETEEAGLPYLWCLSIHGTGMDDFKTLAKVKKHIINEEKKWDTFASKLNQSLV